MATKLAPPQTRSHVATPLTVLSRHRLLTACQERQFAILARAGDRLARNRLIEANLRLVYKIASEYRLGGVELDDLVQDGVIGLMRAIDKYEPARGHRLSTYAIWWIRRAIARAQAAQARTIRFPLHIHAQARALARATQQLSALLGRIPTRTERAQALGLAVAQIVAIDRADRGTVSFSTTVGDGDTDLGDCVADSLDLTEIVEHRLLADAVDRLLASLSPREQHVLRLRFGLRGRAPHTIEDIATHLGLTHERIRQVERRAIRKLRPFAAHQGLHAYVTTAREPVHG